MKNNFVKSFAAGILGLALMSGCASKTKEESHKCATKECQKNKCSSQCKKGKHECSSRK